MPLFQKQHDISLHKEIKIHLVFFSPIKSLERESQARLDRHVKKFVSELVSEHFFLYREPLAVFVRIHNDSATHFGDFFSRQMNFFFNRDTQSQSKQYARPISLMQSKKLIQKNLRAIIQPTNRLLRAPLHPKERRTCRFEES